MFNMRGNHAHPRLINDTVKPAADDDLLEIPAGFAGYRPLEELGQRLKKRHSLPFLRRKRIPVATNNRVHAVFVTREEGAPFQYTRIPPLNSEVMERVVPLPSLASETSDVLQQGFSLSAKTLGALTTGVWASLLLLCSRSWQAVNRAFARLRNTVHAERYTLSKGRYNIIAASLARRSKLVTAGALTVLAIMAAAALLLPGMLSEHQGKGGGKADSSQNTAAVNNAAATSRDDKSSSKKTTAAASTGSTSSPSSGSVPTNSGAGAVSQPGSTTMTPTVIGGRGGGSLPGGSTPSVPTTPISPPPIPGVTTPYTVTIPGQNVQLDDKPVIGTTPIGITLN